MRGLARGFLALERVTTQAAVAAACLGLLVAFLAGAWQVFTRFVLHEPSPWSEALVRQALIWMVLLGVAGAIRYGALVAIDIARTAAHGWLRRGIELLILAALLALFGILFWYGWAMAERVRFQRIAGLNVSIAWGYAAIPVGAAFAIVAAIAAAIAPRQEPSARPV